MPSVLVSELLEYCGQGCCLEGDEALTADDSAERLVKSRIYTHPLTPFSPQAF